MRDHTMRSLTAPWRAVEHVHVRWRCASTASFLKWGCYECRELFTSPRRPTIQLSQTAMARRWQPPSRLHMQNSPLRALMPTRRQPRRPRRPRLRSDVACQFLYTTIIALICLSIASSVTAGCCWHNLRRTLQGAEAWPVAARKVKLVTCLKHRSLNR